MDQPVRVSLLFPRSGQQVFVLVPSHVVQNMDALRFDHKPHRSETSSSSRLGGFYTRENDAHAR